jgi:AcrR family transcriptional regulator
VEAALRLLERDGNDAVTMKRVADEVAASPMGLYRHLKGRDDLLEAMLEERLGALELDRPPDASWRDNVRQWMRHVRTYFVNYPEIFGALDRRAGAISPAWFRTVGALVAPLQFAELNGPELASVLICSRESRRERSSRRSSCP